METYDLAAIANKGAPHDVRTVDELYDGFYTLKKTLLDLASYGIREYTMVTVMPDEVRDSVFDKYKEMVRSVFPTCCVSNMEWGFDFNW